MLEFSELDFVLISTTMYLLGLLTGLVVCCKNKETFLQRAKSTEDISKYNQKEYVKIGKAIHCTIFGKKKKKNETQNT